MSKSLADILAETRTFVQAKEASFKKEAAEQALTNPSSIPGSDNDRPADSGAESSDKEVKQELPPNPQSNVNAGSPEKTEAGHATDATQSISGVKKEPLESAEEIDKGVGGTGVGDQPGGGGGSSAIGGGSRSVAKEANDLLASIRQFQNAKQASTEAPAKQAAPKAAAEDKGYAKAESGETCECGKADCDCEKSEGAKEASELELTQDVLAKIASMILSTEDGWNIVETTMSKAAGAEAARELMSTLEKEAMDQEQAELYRQGQLAADEYVKRAAYEQGVTDALRHHGIDPTAVKQAAGEDFAALGRQAADAAIIKAAQEMGVDMAGAGEAMPELGGDVPGAEMAAGEMVEAPEDDISPEELEQAMAMLVAEGQLSEEEAGAIMEYVSGAGATETAAEMAPEGDTAAAMAAPAEEVPAAPADDMEVQASAKKLKIKALADKIAKAVK